MASAGRILTLGLLVNMIDRASFTAARIGRSLKTLGTRAEDADLAVKSLVGGLLVAFAGKQMLNGVQRMTAESAKFETVMTNVARIMGTGAANFAVLNDEFLKASNTIPASASDLGLVAQQLARLGLTTGLTEKNIANLSKTTVQFATSTGISSEKAAASVGRLLNLFPELRKEFQRNPRVVDGLVSSLLKMDVTSGGTADSIARMTQRFGGLFNGMGRTIDQAFALSAALQNSIDPSKVEPAGTAIMQVFQRLSKRTGDFAEVMGMSEEALSRFSTGKDPAIDFIRLFARKLRELRDSGEDMPKVFAKLGLELARTQPVLFAMANQVEAIDEQLGLANEAFRSGTELMKQYEQKMIPLEARTARLTSTFKSLMTVLGDFSRNIQKGVVIVLQTLLDTIFLVPTPILMAAGALLTLTAVAVTTIGVLLITSSVLFLVGERFRAMAGMTPVIAFLNIFHLNLSKGKGVLVAYAAATKLMTNSIMNAGQRTGFLGASLTRLDKTAKVAGLAAKNGGFAWLFYSGVLKVFTVVSNAATGAVRWLNKNLLGLIGTTIKSAFAAIFSTKSWAMFSAVISTLAGRLLAVAVVFSVVASGSEELAGAMVLLGITMAFFNPLTGFLIVVAALFGQMKKAGLDFGEVFKQIGRVGLTIWKAISVVIKEQFELISGIFRIFGDELGEVNTGLEMLAFGLGMLVGVAQVLAVALAIPFRILGGVLALAGKLTGLRSAQPGSVGKIFTNEIASGSTQARIDIPGGADSPVSVGNEEPGMAEGGVVRGPVRTLVGEGPDDELVTPLNKDTFDQIGAAIARAMASMSPKGSGGGNITIRIPVEIDGHQIAEVVKTINASDQVAAFGA